MYQHYSDYDIGSLLLKQPLYSPKKTNLTPVLSQIQHVFIIVEENHNWQQIYKNPDAPFINTTLLKEGAFASQYYNVPKNLDELHPSEPNYIMLEAGKISFTDHTITTDDPPGAKNSINSLDHLSTLLTQKGFTWKSYQEDISGTDCPIAVVNNYVPRHNPVLYFQDVSGNPPDSANAYCIAHVRPFPELQKDLGTNAIPDYTYITPNLQHDMHNGTIAQADSWLATVVPMIQNSAAFKKDGALFITWDEGTEDDNAKNNPIGMIMLSPFAKKGYTNTTAYSHVSYVKTVEEIFHLSPLLGLAADPKTQDLSDFFTKQ